jgi:hypothetical protein
MFPDKVSVWARDESSGFVKRDWRKTMPIATAINASPTKARITFLPAVMVRRSFSRESDWNQSRYFCTKKPKCCDEIFRKSGRAKWRLTRMK